MARDFLVTMFNLFQSHAQSAGIIIGEGLRLTLQEALSEGCGLFEKDLDQLLYFFQIKRLGLGAP
jgi:hypothetical protein